MKIGVCVSFNDINAMDGKFATLRDQGFDNCQLMMGGNTHLWTDENSVILNGLLAKHGVTISAAWVGWQGPAVWNFYEGQKTLGLIPEEYREMRVGNLCDGADFAKKLGVTDVITHMGYIPENPYDPNWGGFCIAVRTVARHLKANGQFLLFETGQETPVTMLRCFETVGCDNLGINLDTANVILYGKANPVDALEVFGKYVRNLHAKDGCWPTNGRELGRETAIGQGKVNFKALFAKLHELGYDSWVTIEREIEGGQQLTDILAGRAYLQAIIDEVYA